MLSPIFVAVLCIAVGAARAEQGPLEPPDLERYLRWGPLRVRPSVALAHLGYDDNVFYRTDVEPVGDYTATASGRADGLVLFGRRAFLTANARVELTAYARERSQNYWNRFTSGRLTVPFLGFGLYGDFALNNFKDRPADRLDARTDVRETRLGGGFLFRLGWRTDAEIGTVRTSWNYDDPDNAVAGISRDRTETGARAFVRYLVAGRTRATLEAETREVTFDSPEVRTNARQRRALPGLDFGTGGRLSGTVQAGWGRLDPVRPEVPDFSGTVGEIKLAYRLRSGTTLLAGGRRDVRFTVYDDDVYYVVRSADLRAIRYFGRVWGVEAGASRSRLEFPATADRLDRHRQVEVGLRLRLMQNALDRRIEYSFKVVRWRIDSTQDLRDQSRTVVGFGAVAGY